MNLSSHRILVADPIAAEGIERLRAEAEVDVATGLSAGQLIERIDGYDALVVRSETKVTSAVVDAGRRLKVIGRSGVGVDNIDLDAATFRGILVVNSPGGNTVAAAEHTMALIMALSRNVVQANISLRAGKWDRSRFTGVEVLNKTLGVVGLGRIGGEVARRAQGLMMRVIAYDPFLSPETARKRGIELLPLDEVLRRADYVTVHVPLTADTHHLIGERELALMRRDARLINVARGGIVDEEALGAALKNGHLAGAALDVFEHEPLAADSPLLSLPNVIVTPHLGASTREAQVSVAVEVAEEILLALRGDAVRNAVNLPPMPQEVLRRMRPHLLLAEKLGRLAGYLADSAASRLELRYSGEVAETNTALLTRAAIKGFLMPQLSEHVNLVNAQAIAVRRGVAIHEEKTSSTEGFASLISMRVVTQSGSRAVAGTLFGADPRIVGIDGYRVDFEPFGYMLIDNHLDKPGMIGQIGTILGNHHINIAGLHLGRASRGGIAVTVLSVDDPVPTEVLNMVRQVDGIEDLRFVDLTDDR
ncbi:MAG: phosphoglycerate dehydrogenase [Chloroflexi bacterium]|nr:phosphoglycerate dehydrogenase [Chloroflexota bacterium]